MDDIKNSGTPNQRRLGHVDVLKGAGILLVVFGHFIEQPAGDSALLKTLYVGIYSFHMPLFVFLSGIFARQTLKTKDYRKIVWTLFVPLVVFQIVYVGVGRWTGWGTYPPLAPYWILWFIASLIAWRLLLPLFASPIGLLVATLGAVLAGFDQSVGYALSASRTIYFLPFFILGHLYGRQLIALAERHRGPFIGLFVATIAIVLLWWQHGLDPAALTGSHDYNGAAPDKIYPGAARLILMTLSLSALVGFCGLVPSRLAGLEWLGKPLAFGLSAARARGDDRRRLRMDGFHRRSVAIACRHPSRRRCRHRYCLWRRSDAPLVQPAGKRRWAYDGDTQWRRLTARRRSGLTTRWRKAILRGTPASGSRFSQDLAASARQQSSFSSRSTVEPAFPTICFARSIGTARSSARKSMERAEFYAEPETLAEAKPGGFPIPDNVFAETVTDVRHFTDRLFKFRITRPKEFRFRSGEFVMIGLPNAEKPVYRAYSIASPFWDDEIEFFSIKVPGGPLTEHLQRIAPGDTVLMRKKATGTLVVDALVPGKRIYMLSTGTGVAPFASLIRDPETYDKFEEIVLVQTCREKGELAYITEMVEALKDDPLIGELVAGRLRLYTTTTREPFERMGRITDLMKERPLLRGHELGADRSADRPRDDLRIDRDVA